ncbi:MAG: bifunctional phosphopantothenoylcysteine decarboxylase/phosphopantothenate--cysteine ligase CoaBC [Pseudomonadales bacterium]|nr:bifunctional phosphopantothenoylcysteine decarboxylase/phosphopantothenate--cysteine ligase CoaBC [Pseudomonadales bacterium]
MSPLHGIRILLGITGGIAAYKTPQLVRLLRQQGAEVQVVMTAGAAHFVTATSLQAVSGRPVRDDLWDPAAEAHMGHIELARWAQLLLVAPATADRLSRAATGHADDLLGAIWLATRAPKWLAPAMNTVMWEAAPTARNLATLKADGVHIIGPEYGDQACGETGDGRMAEPEQIIARLCAAASGQPLDQSSPADPAFLHGKRVVITAGPTREAIDPVRYISNHSSGKQGYAMAEAARDAGAEVILISGPVRLQAPPGVTLIAVNSALEMHDASLQHAPDCALFIGVAAVADYRPAAAADQKIKKKPGAGGRLSLDLIENPDIIAGVAALPGGPVVIGFAAETEQALAHARRKLKHKGLDAIVVNDVSRTDIGFNSDDNAATLIWAEGEMQLAKQDKYSLAQAVLRQVSTLFVHQLAHTNPADMAD